MLTFNFAGSEGLLSYFVQAGEALSYAGNDAHLL